VIKQVRELLNRAGVTIKSVKINGAQKCMERKFSRVMEEHQATVQEIAELINEECSGCNPGDDGDGATS